MILIRAVCGLGLTLLLLSGCSGSAVVNSPDPIAADTSSPTDTPPTLAGQPGTSVVAGTAYSFTPTVTDPSGGTLTFTISNKPAWAVFDALTGVLSGTPSSAAVGNYSGIVIGVSDGTETASLASFSIQVLAAAGAPPVVDPAPTIKGTPATSVTAGQAYSFTPTAVDPNGEKLTFSVAKLPSWAAFNTTTGALTGTPAASFVGNYNGIVISVTDGTSTASLASFSIKVNAAAVVTTPAPTISGKPAATVTVGQAYAFTPTTTDPSGGKLSYSISKMPTWAAFSATTGALTGTPTASAVGTYSNIAIGVSDGKSSATMAPFSITVNAALSSAPPPPPAAAPTISGTPSTSVTAGAAYTFQPTATGASGKTLTFAVTNKPAWATFSTSTGLLSGTPSSTQTGTFANIGISVSDGSQSAALTAFTITVAAASTGSNGGSGSGSGQSVVVSVAGGGVVTSTGGATNLNCTSAGGTCGANFNTGAAMVLTATTNSGYTFQGWRAQGGTPSGCSGSSCSLSQGASTQFLTAVFQNNSTLNPVALYTDITSGPNTGGENGNGIYLTVFGKNFGAGALGSAVKVYINDVEVAHYFGSAPKASRGRTDIQQIAVQIGALGRVAAVAGNAPSAPLPIKVIVDGRVSNPSATSLADPTFVINPGNIYFVNNVSGVDTSGTTTGGTIAAPFKSVQRSAGASISFGIDSAANAGAWGRVQAGDFMVMRGTGTDWNGDGFTGYFLQTLNKSGCPLGSNCAQGGGASSGPITLMGYPGEDVFINGAYASGVNGAISSADSSRIEQGFGAQINIVDLRIEGGNYDGAINTQAGGSYWRIVNNELTAITAATVVARAGGIHGSGQGHFWVGNHIHDVYCGPNNGPANPLENHGIYIGDTGSYEVAYNLINNIYGGNGIQTHIGGSAQSVDNLSFHHNIVHDVNKHGINLADGSRNGFQVWNNIVYNTVGAGIRMGGTSMLSGAKIYNNLFYNTNLEKNAATGAIENDMVAAANQMDVRNNIFYPSAGTLYNSGSNNGDFTGGIGTITHNLWMGGSNAVPRFDTAPKTGNPLFTLALLSPAGSSGLYLTVSSVLTTLLDFHLLSGSPAIDTGDAGVASLVVDDFDVATATQSRTLRPMSGGYDIGPYEQ